MTSDRERSCVCPWYQSQSIITLMRGCRTRAMWILLAMFFQSSAFPQVVSSPKQWAPNINWARLVANPKEFSGKRIVLHGWFTATYSQDDTVQFTLWLNREAWEAKDETACVRLEEKSLNKVLIPKPSTWSLLNGERVRVQGVLHWDEETYNESSFVGVITDIGSFSQEKPGFVAPTKR